VPLSSNRNSGCKTDVFSRTLYHMISPLHVMACDHGQYRSHLFKLEHNEPECHFCHSKRTALTQQTYTEHLLSTRYFPSTSKHSSGCKSSDWRANLHAPIQHCWDGWTCRHRSRCSVCQCTALSPPHAFFISPVSHAEVLTQGCAINSS
jgi:hypothetical protein